MEREKLEGLLIDFIDGRLNDSDRKEVRELLSTDSEVRVLYEQLKQVTSAMDRSSEINPSTKLHHSFQQMLKDEAAREYAPKQRHVFFTPAVLRAAAAVVLVMIGAVAGYYINKYNVQQERLAALEREFQEQKTKMLTQIEDQNSASQRMRGVNVALGINRADDDVVNALVKALNEDKNTNVRLAALDALSNFKDEPKVRKELVGSLSKQTDPIVQIALIQLMVKMKEKGIINDLNKIIEDSDAIKPVKDEAYSGILKLS